MLEAEARELEAKLLELAAKEAALLASPAAPPPTAGHIRRQKFSASITGARAAASSAALAPPYSAEELSLALAAVSQQPGPRKQQQRQRPESAQAQPAPVPGLASSQIVAAQQVRRSSQSLGGAAGSGLLVRSYR